MKTKQAKVQIKELKKEIRTKRLENDLLLLKLFVLLILVSVVAGIYFGKIPLPQLPNPF